MNNSMKILFLTMCMRLKRRSKASHLVEAALKRHLLHLHLKLDLDDLMLLNDVEVP